MKALVVSLIMTVSMFISTAHADYTIYPFPVCEGGTFANPDIDGDIVVWQGSDTDIYWKQLGDPGQPNRIIADGTQTYPAVSGDIVVWYNYNTQRDICSYDLQAGGEPLNITNDSPKQWYPDVSGNYIVYEHYTSDNVYNIYLYGHGVIEGKTTQQLRPAIDGDIVVWGDARADGFENYDIYYYDLSSTSPEAYPVYGSPGDRWHPDVSGSVVVWREDPGDGSGFNIYGYDLNDPATGRISICTVSGNQEYPAISGNIVVWENMSDSSIWAFDLDNRAEGIFEVSDGTGSNTAPAVYVDPVSGKKTIVWAHNGDIVAAELQDYSDVEVTSPDGGESFTAGDPMLITWTADGAVPSVLIEFSSNGGADWAEVATVSGTNSYLWGAVENVDSTDCLIRITNTKYPNVTSISDGPFEVHPIPDEIAVISPNGGEMVLAGSEMEIQWTSVGDVNDVVILFSPDNEQTWQTVTASTANDGAFTWDAVPADANSVQCLIHISDVTDSSTWDMNDDHFTVFQCKTSLTADLTGDCFVNIADYAELARQWLDCGNPYDPAWCLRN